MVGHTLAKLFATALDIFIFEFIEAKKLQEKGQAIFRRNHCTYDYILTLKAIIEEAKANKCRVYCCFIDFIKAFDIVPRQLLLQRLKDLGILEEVILLVMTLYKKSH